MGKQISFYMSENIQEAFIEYLEQNRFRFLESDLGIINQPSSLNIFMMYLYKPDYGEIVMRQDYNAIDTMKSPVIEYRKTIMKAEEKKVLRGRLWISDRYYDDDCELVKKKENFVKDYQRLNRWIKKYVPYQEYKLDEYLVKEYVNDELKELQERGFILTM